MKRTLLTVAALVLVTSQAFAGDSKGIDVIQFTDDVPSPGYYVDCVGENIFGTRVIESRYLEFETPSGTFHVVDNWKIAVYFSGLLTGRSWAGHGVSPFQLNSKLEKGQILQWVARVTMMPLDDESPVWVYQNEFKLTVNAKGDLIVFNDEDDFLGGHRCLGPE